MVSSNTINYESGHTTGVQFARPLLPLASTSSSEKLAGNICTEKEHPKPFYTTILLHCIHTVLLLSRSIDVERAPFAAVAERKRVRIETANEPMIEKTNESFPGTAGLEFPARHFHPCSLFGCDADRHSLFRLARSLAPDQRFESESTTTAWTVCRNDGRVLFVYLFL